MNDRQCRYFLQHALDLALVGKMENIQRAVELDMNLNYNLEDGITALEVATEAGDIQLVRFLLDAGADPNAGWPLLCAAYRGWREIYEILFPLVSEEAQVEASQELPEGLKRRYKAENDPDYYWDD